MGAQESIVIPQPEGEDAIRHAIVAASPRLLAIMAKQVRFPWVTRERARDQTRSLLEAWKNVVNDGETVFDPAFLAQLEDAAAELPNLAGTFWATDVAANTPQTAPTKAERDALLQEVAAADSKLTRWMIPAVEEFGTNDERATALMIRRGTGHQDNSNDVVGWTSMALGNPQIEAVLPMAKDELLTMQARALHASALLGGTDNPLGSPADLRNRAFSLWADTYERLVRNGRHIATELRLPTTFDGIHMLPTKPAPAKSEPATVPPGDSSNSVIAEETA